MSRGVYEHRPGGSLKEAKRTFKKGIYLTSYGNAAYVGGHWSKTAYDLDMGERIPIEEVTTKFIREAEDSDLPSNRR